jgi:hypothetical protein
MDLIDEFDYKCRNPTLKECEDDTHTPKMGDLGVLWDFKKFKVQL